MSSYRYTALAPDGKAVKGTIEAATVKGAMASLIDQSYDVKALKARKSVFQFEITRKKLKLADVMHVSRQLAAFTKAGVPLPDAIQVIEEDVEDKTLKGVLTAVRGELRTGETLSAALSTYSTLFPPFYVDMIRAAELAGTLDVVLEDMSNYIERDLESRQKIKSALMYPIIILLFAIGTVLFLSIYVLPKFVVFFASFHATLPLPTRMLMRMTDFMRSSWILLVGGGIALFVLVALAFRTKPGRKFRDLVLLKMPAIGKVVQYSIIERFCRLLAALTDAGVPLPEAMTVLARGTSNKAFEEGLTEVRAAMLRGEGIARPIAASGLFPGAVVQMIRVGENTGTLDAQLQNAATYYSRELEHRIKRLTTLFEPAVIVVMGVVVGFVAIAMISAMYGIYNQVHFN
jgi:type IV pilus assembly protein PilC